MDLCGGCLAFGVVDRFKVDGSTHCLVEGLRGPLADADAHVAVAERLDETVAGEIELEGPIF